MSASAKPKKPQLRKRQPTRREALAAARATAAEAQAKGITERDIEFYVSSAFSAMIDQMIGRVFGVTTRFNKVEVANTYNDKTVIGKVKSWVGADRIAELSVELLEQAQPVIKSATSFVAEMSSHVNYDLRNAISGRLSKLAQRDAERDVDEFFTKYVDPAIEKGLDEER